MPSVGAPAAPACAVNLRIRCLRRLAYVFGAKNYMPVGVKDELDLVGCDGETRVFVEIRTIPDDSSTLPALAELSVTRSKQAVLVRTAQRFLADAISAIAPLASTSGPSTISPANPR
jgi:Holliday junction resolvase-like predicted endonuclease